MAEVVKTGLLMGEPVWELPLAELVRRVRRLQGWRSVSPTRTTMARVTSSTSATPSGTRSRAAAGYDLSHGKAVALGDARPLVSGNGPLSRCQRAAPPASRFASTEKPRGQRWRGTRSRRREAGLVLLARYGEPTWGNELPAADVRAALDGAHRRMGG